MTTLTKIQLALLFASIYSSEPHAPSLTSKNNILNRKNRKQTFYAVYPQVIYNKGKRRYTKKWNKFRDTPI